MNPIETPYVMWFDDDSFIKDEMIGVTPGFLQSVADVMEHPSPADQRAAGKPFVVVMEGITDVWRLPDYGVALLGKPGNFRPSGMELGVARPGGGAWRR